MTQELLINIVGYAAAVCMVFGYLPQAIYTIRTRETDSIAMPTFTLMGLGGMFFVAQGVLTDNTPLVITNLITTICSVIIVAIKIYNESKKKKEKK